MFVLLIVACLVRLDPELGIAHDKLKEFAHSSCDRVYENEDRGPVETLKNSMSFLLAEVAGMAQVLQEAEYDNNTSTQAATEKVRVLARWLFVRRSVVDPTTLKSLRSWLGQCWLECL